MDRRSLQTNCNQIVSEASRSSFKIPMLPFQNKSLTTTKGETWKILTKVAEIFLTSCNEYQTKTLNLVLKVGVLVRESKECRRGLSRSREKLTNFKVELVQILVCLLHSIGYLLKIIQLSQFGTKKSTAAKLSLTRLPKSTILLSRTTLLLSNRKVLGSSFLT